MTRAVEDPDQPIVRAALFFPGPSGKVHLHVEGDNFVERAVPVLARVGEQMVSGLLLHGDGRGFAGTLERRPRDGERLFVGYADTDLQRTHIVVRGGDGGASAVASRREDDAEHDEADDEASNESPGPAAGSLP